MSGSLARAGGAVVVGLDPMTGLGPTMATMSPRVRVLLPVRWSDVDLFGHVNNAAWVRFLDDARFAAFPTMGVDAAGSVAEAVMVVVKNEIDYRAPVAFTSRPLAVQVWVSRIGTSSVDFGYEAHVADDDAHVGAGDAEPGAVLVARSRMVQIDRVAGRPRAFGDEERAELARHLDSEPVLREW